MSDLSSFASAIATAEGYGVAGAIPTVRNNPGDLTSGGTITTYSSPEAGQSALMAKLQNIMNGGSKVYSPNMTISQMGQKWANGDTSWAQNVATKLGVSTDSTLYSVLGMSINDAPTSLGDTLSLGAKTAASTLYQSAAATHKSVIGKYIEDAILVCIGLMLLAAAFMAFKNSSTVISVVGKTAKTAVEAAA